MTKYKIVDSTDKKFVNMELAHHFEDAAIGSKHKILDHEFEITQNGKALILSSPTWVLSLLEIPQTVQFKIPNDLRINHEVDVFLDTKIITIRETDRLTKSAGLTIKRLYDFLRNEWKYIKMLSGVQFPLEYYETINAGKTYPLLILNDSWNIQPLEAISLLRDGSFIRKNAEGKVI